MSRSLERIRSGLGAAVTAAAPGLESADRLCVACVDLLGVDGAAISLMYDGESRGTYGSSGARSRRLDEYQFTFGEGPCLDAVADRAPVLVPDLDSPQERRWPAFAGAALEEGIHAVFALPVVLTSVCVGALDLFRRGPGPLTDTSLAGGLLAAELASLPVLDLANRLRSGSGPGAGEDQAQVAERGDRDGWSQLADLDRVEVYQATGMLIAQLDVEPAEALVRLRAHAIATGQTASMVAWSIVERRLVLTRDHHSDSGGWQP